MASRARTHFEAALGVLLVARSGQAACTELATIMTGWDGKLTVLLRKRVSRHIRRCAVCGARRRRELTPDTLLGVLPVAVLPAALRHQVLSLVTVRRRPRRPTGWPSASGSGRSVQRLPPPAQPAQPDPAVWPASAGRDGRGWRGHRRRGTARPAACCTTIRAPARAPCPAPARSHRPPRQPSRPRQAGPPRAQGAPPHWPAGPTRPPAARRPPARRPAAPRRRGPRHPRPGRLPAWSR